MESWVKVKDKLLLGLILIIGAGLFSYKLGSIPPGVYVDEAVVGYDAYSILETGKDHYGQRLPIYFKFFNSYTPGLFVYIEAAAVKLGGLNAVVIRSVSGLSMLAVAVALYWFFKRQKFFKHDFMDLLATLLFLITPWTVFNARLGYETTFAFALLALGILLYEYPTLAFTLVSLSTYAGHSERYLAPIIMAVICGIFYFRKAPFEKMIRSIAVAVILQIPNIILMFTPSFWVKNDSLTGNFWGQYLSYFSPVNLFYKQDFDLQRSVPEIAVFYSWMLWPWLLGLWQIWKNKNDPRYQYVAWLTLILPVPAALANVNYSTQRALPLLLPYFIIIALGMDKIWQWTGGRVKVFIVGGFLVLSLIMLWRSYFILFPAQRQKAWNKGYEEVARLINQNPDKNFVVDNSRGVPGMLVLFWLKYPPYLYQQQNPSAKNYYFDMTYSDLAKFGKVEVRPINWKVDPCQKEILVGDDLAISSGQVKEHELVEVLMIKDNRRQILVQAYQTNPEKKCKRL